jgi:hypothetical protein
MLEGVPPLVHIGLHLSVSLAGHGPSDGADPPRRCRGCSHPPLRPQGWAAPSFRGLLRQTRGGLLHPARMYGASWRTPEPCNTGPSKYMAGVGRRGGVGVSAPPVAHDTTAPDGGATAAGAEALSGVEGAGAPATAERLTSLAVGRRAPTTAGRARRPPPPRSRATAPPLPVSGVAAGAMGGGGAHGGLRLLWGGAATSSPRMMLGVATPGSGRRRSRAHRGSVAW